MPKDKGMLEAATSCQAVDQGDAKRTAVSTTGKTKIAWRRSSKTCPFIGDERGDLRPSWCSRGFGWVAQAYDPSLDKSSRDHVPLDSQHFLSVRLLMLLSTAVC